MLGVPTFDVTVFDVTAFEVAAFEATALDVTAFEVTALDVTVFNVTTFGGDSAPGLSVTDRSPPEAPESPVAAFAIEAAFAIDASLTHNPLAALPLPRRTLEARSEGNDGDSSVARSRERARDGVSLAASAM